MARRRWDIFQSQHRYGLWTQPQVIGWRNVLLVNKQVAALADAGEIVHDGFRGGDIHDGFRGREAFDIVAVPQILSDPNVETNQSGFTAVWPVPHFATLNEA